MKRYIRFTFCVFLLLIFTAGTCPAVTVPGHDGTELALSQIGDIIRHVTGQTEGDLSFRKESLLVTTLKSADILTHADPSNPNDTLEGIAGSFDVYGFDGQGNYRKAGTSSFADFTLDCDVIPSGINKFSMVTFPQDGSKGIEASPAVRFDDEPAQSTFAYDITVGSPVTDSSGDISVSLQTKASNGASFRDILNLSGVPSEIENGMTVKGIDGYISAVLVRENATPHLYFAKLETAADVSKIPCEYSQTIPDDSLPKFSDGNPFFPASIAAGDFDNDGYRNEVALTWSDIDHVYARVVQLSYDTGSKQYSLREIYSSTVHDYEYSSIGIDRNRGKDMDGAGTIYSASVVAGDFDGVPGDEFAVVFRDNKPDNADNFYKSHEEPYHDRMYHHDTSTFEGLTGGINVVTHKWNGSTFQTAQARKAYDTYSADNGKWSMDQDSHYVWTLFIYYYFPVAARAIVADMNGDGRDDIVVQRMSFNFCDDNTLWEVGSQNHSFHHFIVETNIDVWNFDGGSIQPNPGASFTAASATYQGGYGTQNVYADDGKFKRDMFIKMVSRTDTPYPFFERECDII
ncbi:MAG: hypothetical protein IJM68_11815, partial [Synergistaceae bacterium]|nr:hypothetical protein [Synergistaceae bacterium]